MQPPAGRKTRNSHRSGSPPSGSTTARTSTSAALSTKFVAPFPRGRWSFVLGLLEVEKLVHRIRTSSKVSETVNSSFFSLQLRAELTIDPSATRSIRPLLHPMTRDPRRRQPRFPLAPEMEKADPIWDCPEARRSPGGSNRREADTPLRRTVFPQDLYNRWLVQDSCRKDQVETGIDDQAQPKAVLVFHDIWQRAEIDLEHVGFLPRSEQTWLQKSPALASGQ